MKSYMHLIFINLLIFPIILSNFLPQKPIALFGHERSITQIKYNREGDLLFSTAKDTTPGVWYSVNGERLGTFDGHSGAVWCIDVDCILFNLNVFVTYTEFHYEFHVSLLQCVPIKRKPIVSVGYLHWERLPFVPPTKKKS